MKDSKKTIGHYCNAIHSTLMTSEDAIPQHLGQCCHLLILPLTPEFYLLPVVAQVSTRSMLSQIRELT